MADHLPSLKASRSSNHDEAIEAPKGDFFPVSLYINDEQVEAMKLGGVELGEERMLVAMVRVTSLSMHEGESGKTKTVNLDLIEGVTSPKSKSTSEEEKATALFGSAT